MRTSREGDRTALQMSEEPSVTVRLTRTQESVGFNTR